MQYQDHGFSTRTSTWTKSTYCDSAACVEVRVTESASAIRDSKDPASPVIEFSRPQWQRFLADVKTGAIGR